MVDVASFSTPSWLIICGGIFGTSNLLIKFVILFLITLEMKAIKTFPVVFVMIRDQLLSILRLQLSYQKRMLLYSIKTFSIFRKKWHPSNSWWRHFVQRECKLWCSLAKQLAHQDRKLLKCLVLGRSNTKGTRKESKHTNWTQLATQMVSDRIKKKLDKFFT